MLTNDVIKKIPIFSKYNGYSLSEIEPILQMSAKQILADIDRINDVLREFGDSLITVVEGRIHLPKISIQDLFAKMTPKMEQYYFLEEREWMIVLYLFLEQDFVSNFHLQSYLRVSKNTVLADLKQLRYRLDQMEVKLLYSRKDGYYLKGHARQIHYLIELAVSRLLKFESGKWVLRYIFSHCCLKMEIETVLDIFLEYNKNFPVSFIEERIEATAYLFLCLLNIRNIPPIQFTENEKKTIESANVLLFTDRFISRYPSLTLDRFFIASRLLGCIQGDLHRQVDPAIQKIMTAITETVTANTGIVFDEDKKFKKNLYNHLAPAYYRLMFNMPLLNPLKDQILEEYASLFYLIKKSLYPLSEALQTEITEDEIAYFTMHFGGYLSSYQSQEQTRQLEAITVCLNGVSASNILTWELRSLMPEVNFRQVYQLDDVSKLDSHKYDLVFSTVYFETDKPLYLVQPFMNAVEKSILKNKVYKDFQLISNQELQLEEIIKLIDKSCTIHDELALRKDLTAYYLKGQTQSIKWGELSLNDLLTKELIQIEKRVDTWQEGIELAAQPLLEQGYIEPSYIQEMINSVLQLGAYIVLVPHVALAHAAPEKGVKRLGVSLLQLQEAVDFNQEGDDYDEDRQVKLIFVLAAVDSSAHLKALQQMVSILDNEEILNQLMTAKSENQVYQLIDECIKGGKENA